MYIGYGQGWGLTDGQYFFWGWVGLMFFLADGEWERRMGAGGGCSGWVPQMGAGGGCCGWVQEEGAADG